MEFIAVIIAAVLGWTTVTTAASVPYVSAGGVLVTLAVRTLLIAVPYGIGMLLKRWRRGKR